MTDPITDLFNRIRNAQAVFAPTVSAPFSGMKHDIAKILEQEGFVKKVERKGRGVKRFLEIQLQYTKIGGDASSKLEPKIDGLKRISKPGKRMYVPASQIKRVRGGYGIAILSTPKGVMTNKEARRQKVGGEILGEIW